MSQNKLAVGKIDLALVKRLVSELEKALELADKLSADHLENVVELNKAAGLASGIMSEAVLLVGDIQGCIRGVSGVAPSAKTNDLLAELFGGSSLKGSGSSNN